MVKFTRNLNFACKLIVLTALFMLRGGYLVTASANDTNYYAKVTATASPTGAGTVYVSTANTTPKQTDYAATSSVSGSNSSTGQAASITFYFFANPAEGYVFKNWTSGSTVISTSKNISQLLSSDKSTQSDPATFTYTANFAKAGDVVVMSSDETLGSAGIDIPTNTIGQTVTLTASNDKFSSQFDYWVGPDGERVSGDNPYTFEVTESNKGTYKAVFNAIDIKNQGLYCYIGNVTYGGTTFSGNALGLMGLSETTQSVNSNQRYTNNSLMLAGSGNNSDRMHSSPAFVLKLTGTPDGGGGLKSLDAQAQGHKLSEIITSGFAYTAANVNYGYLNGLVGGIYLTAYFTGEGNNGSATQEGFGKVFTPGIFNKSGEDQAYRWQIYPINDKDKNIGYFGAMPREGQKIGERYYTTMYAAFPYQCIDDVKAYYVSGLNDDGTVQLTEIESGIVPKNTPVILSCLTTKPVTNRLIPLLDETQDAITGNLLKGEIWLKDIKNNKTADNYDTYRTKFDASSMRVLSFTDGNFANVNNSDILDNGKTGLLTYIENNTAYLSTDNMTDAQKALFAQHDTWKLFPDKAELTIDGDNGSADNWSSVNASKVADVTLTRNMANDGGWYSLCLPFDINATDLKAAFGDDVDLEELSTSESSDDNVSVTFKKVDALNAGKPYLIKLSKDFTTYTFKDVTVYGDDVTPENFGNGYTFQGTKQFNSEDIRANYGTRARFLGGSDGLNLKTPSKSSKPLKPTRCFFVYPENASSAKTMTFTMGGQDTPTGIDHITLDNIDRDIQRPTDNRIYSLTGQYVGTDFSTLPKGIYIVNGKKVMK